MSRSFKKLYHNKYIKAISGKKAFVNRFKQYELEENYPIRKTNRIKSKKDKDLLASYCVDCCYNKGNISRILHKILSNKIDLFDNDYFKNRNQINLLRKQLKEQFDIKEEMLFEEIEQLGWNIRILRKNDPYVNYYYQTSFEKPKSKYELYKDLKNLVFMKLDQIYSYGAHEYEICLNYGGRENLEESYKNILLLRNNRRYIYVEIDVKKHNTVQKVIDYLLSRGYGVLLPSLVPKDYDCYYYWTEQLLKDGTFINHHNNIPRKRFLEESEHYFLDVLKLLIQTHKFEVKFINGYKLDELYILMKQLIAYYNLLCNKKDRKYLSF